MGQFGTSLEKQQLAMLQRELERAASKGDGKAIQRATAEIEALRWRVLFKHDWFWREIFDSLCRAEHSFRQSSRSTNSSLLRDKRQFPAATARA